MASDASNGTVLVAGHEDLVTTSLVSALGAHGIAAERAALRTARPLRPEPAHRRAGVLVVDLHRCDVALVVDAVAAGWKVLVIEREGGRARAAAAVAAGAVGTVSMAMPLGELVRRLLDVLAGRPVLSGAERTAWLEFHRCAQEYAETRTRRLDALTQRELEVLEQLERGRRAAEIAAEWVVSISTVRTQIRSVLTKLGVNSQQQAVVVYREAARVRLG